MKKSLLCFLLLCTLSLKAQYHFDETIFIPLQEDELSKWKIEHQGANDEGSCSTRYILESEAPNHWSKLLNIKFKDRELIQVNTALEAFQQEQQGSPEVNCNMLMQHPNDLTYERSFPTGEQELVRMIMTKKGLHRISFVKRGTFDENERDFWLDRLVSSVVGK